jgi:hypothetical protein
VKIKVVLNKIILISNLLELFIFLNLQYGFWRALNKNDIIMYLFPWVVLAPLLLIIYYFVFRPLLQTSLSDKIIFILNLFILLYLGFMEYYFIFTTPIM